MTTTYAPPAEPMPTWAAPPPLAARAEAAVKVYGRGGTEVRALDDVERRPARWPVHRHHGSVGVGKEHADACPRRPRHADVGPCVARRHRVGQAQRSAAHQDPPGADRVRVPGVQPAADVVSRREHRPADDPRRNQAGQSVGRRRRRHRRPRRPPPPPAQRALRRPATARRRRPGAGLEARTDLCRRADRESRQPRRQRDPRLHAPRRRQLRGRRS